MIPGNPEPKLPAQIAIQMQLIKLLIRQLPADQRTDAARLMRDTFAEFHDELFLAADQADVTRYPLLDT